MEFIGRNSLRFNFDLLKPVEEDTSYLAQQFPQPIQNAYSLSKDPFRKNEFLEEFSISIDQKSTFENIIWKLGQIYCEFRNIYLDENPYVKNKFDQNDFNFDNMRNSPNYNKYIPALIFKEGWGPKSIYSLYASTLALEIPEEFVDDFLDIVAGTILVFNTLDSFDRDSTVVRSFQTMLALHRDFYTNITQNENLSDLPNPFLRDEIVASEYGDSNIINYILLGSVLVEAAALAKQRIIALNLPPNILDTFNKIFLSEAETAAYIQASVLESKNLPDFEELSAKYTKRFPFWLEVYFGNYKLDRYGSPIGFYVLLAEYIKDPYLSNNIVRLINYLYSDAHGFYHVLLNDAVGIIEDYPNGSLIYHLLELSNSGEDLEFILALIWEDLQENLIKVLVKSNRDSYKMHYSILVRLYNMYKNKFASINLSIANDNIQEQKIIDAFNISKFVMDFFGNELKNLKMSLGL